MRRVWNKVAGVVALLALLAGGVRAASRAQTTGIVLGRVVDATRGEVLPGALVRVHATATSKPVSRSTVEWLIWQ